MGQLQNILNIAKVCTYLPTTYSTLSSGTSKTVCLPSINGKGTKFYLSTCVNFAASACRGIVAVIIFYDYFSDRFYDIVKLLWIIFIALAAYLYATGCGFDSHFADQTLLDSYFRCSGVEAQRWVPPLNTQFLQNLAENGDRSVLTLDSLYLPCCVR